MAGNKQGCVRCNTDKFNLFPDLGKIEDFNIFIWVSLNFLTELIIRKS